MRTRSTLGALGFVVLGSFALASGCAPEAGDGAPEGGASAAPPGARRSADGDYQQTRYYEGLGENVTIIKGYGGAYARREGGARVGLPELQRLEAEARRAKFGALAPEFSRWLDAKPAGEALPVAIYFEPGAPLGAWADRLRDPSNSGRQKARGDLRAAVAGRGAALGAAIERAGATEIRAAAYLPALYALATPSVARAIAQMAGVVLVNTAQGGRPEAHASATNAITDPQIDTGFNDRGYFGSGQKVGFVEAASCGLYENHEAFGSTGVSYMVEPLPCKDAADCDVCDIDSSGFAACIDLGRGFGPQCVTGHASQTASNVAASVGGTDFGAAKAALYYANQGAPVTWGPPESVACSDVAIAGAYDWFVKEDVTTTNESFGCLPSDGPVDGMTQDYYARYFGISIFKSAGNAGREGLACRYTLNSICVGATDGGSVASFSSSRNPPNAAGKPGDREEPDLVALGVDVDVLDVFGSTTDWTTNDGTSFAAPAMAGFGALLKEACGGGMDQRLMRAMLQNGAWPKNPESHAYSTPAPGVDYRDGSGGLVANSALLFCGIGGGGGPASEAKPIDVDLTGGGPLPEGPSKYDPSKPPGSKGQSYTPPGPSDGRRGERYFGLHLKPGNRVRATFIWDSCPAAVSGAAPASVATDIDIFLYNRTANRYVFGSQSIDDSSEGYDVTISDAEGEGDFELYYAFPEKSPGCGGSTIEPAAWAVTWWS